MSQGSFFDKPQKDTLAEERDRLFQKRKEPGGTRCHACNQHAQEYRIKLNAGMARFLVELYKRGCQYLCEPVRYEEIIHAVGTASLDYARIKYWLLIEPVGEIPDRKKASGEWRMTRLGCRFVTGKVKVASHVRVYNSAWIDSVEPAVGIRDVLPKEFDYQEHVFGSASPDPEQEQPPADWTADDED